MRTPSKNVIGVLLLAAAAALAPSCKVKGERQAYSQVAADGEALRAAFNAEAGKVRVIVLVAPT
jgi:hypothetical protein